MTESAEQPTKRKAVPVKSRMAWVMSNAVPVGLVLGLCLGVANPLSAQITQDAYVTYSGVTNIGILSGVSVIDTAGQAVVNNIPTIISFAFAVAVAPDGRYAYVSAVNSVSVIDTATQAIVKTIRFEQEPAGLAITPDGLHLYVTIDGFNTVSVIDTGTETVVNTIPVGLLPGWVAVALDGRHAYVANTQSGTVSVIDTASQAVVNTITVGEAPKEVAVTPDGLYAFVTSDQNTVSVIDTATLAVVNTIAVGRQPQAFGSFVGPNLITGNLGVESETALTGLGFGQFVDFRGGTLDTKGRLNDGHTLSLIRPGGTININHGFDSTFSGSVIGGLLHENGRWHAHPYRREHLRWGYPHRRWHALS